jgi:signal transduction histidine kinase
MHAQLTDPAAAPSAPPAETLRAGSVRSATQLRWLIVALGLATNAAILGLLAFDLDSARERALGDAGRAAETLAVALEEHATQTFTRLDLGLRALDDDPTTPGITFPSDLVKAQAQLAQILRLSPTLSALELTDAAGRVLASAESLKPPDRRYGEAEAYAVHRDDANYGLYVGLLKNGPRPSEWSIAVSRRLERPDQSFAGTVIGKLNTDYFQRLYRSIDVQSKGSVSLFLRDGTLLARHPSFDALIGASIGDDPVFRDYVSKSLSGTFRALDSVDGQGRIVSIRIFRGLPLVLTVSVPESTVLADWQIVARDDAVLVLVAILATWILVVAVLRMISVREQWERELAAVHAAEEAARRRAEDSSNAKSEFVATISHELRTPLNAMLGFAEMIRDQVAGPIGEPRYAGYARTIVEAGTRLMALVNDLLDIAKIEAGKFELEESLVNPMALVGECVDMLQPQIRGGGLAIDLVPPVEAFLMRADREALTRAVLNLLSNAIKFTPEGGHITVTTARDARGGGGIAVRDTGIGMSAAGLQHAFEPFGQIRNPQARAREGTGLGLPIARRLIELHGGALNLDSFPGSGTTATIRMPAFRIESAARATTLHTRIA